MKYDWLDAYLLGKKGVTKDLQTDWNWIRYHIGGKMFAAVCLEWQDNKPYYITFKLEPSEGDFLRTQYEDIIPGYYMNKVHWNSVKAEGNIPDELLKDLLDKSYRLVLSGFSKKRQRELSEMSCCGTECKKCSLYGTMCEGCNECQGKVFHAPKGKACPIYACSVNRKKLKNCAQCELVPCTIWKETKDPKLSNDEFEKSIAERVNNLKK